MVDGIRHWWVQGTESLRRFLLGVLIVSVGTSAYFFYKHGEFFEEVSRQRKALYVLADETIQKPAIVFIRGFLGDRHVMAEEDAVRNDPSLDSLILYAHDLGDKNKSLQSYYPEREIYRGSYDRELKQARLQKV